MGLIHVLSLSNLVISLWISLSYSTMIMFKCGQFKLYWNGDDAFILMPCNWNHLCFSLSISTMIISMRGKIFDDISSCLEYLCVGPPKSIGYRSLIRIMPGTIGAAPISSGIISLGSNDFLLFVDNH